MALLNQYREAISIFNFSAASKLLESEIKALEGHCVPEATISQLYYNKGRCSEKLQLYRKAIKDYDSVLKIDPQHVGALYRKGKTLVALRKVEDARDCFEAARSVVGLTMDMDLAVEIAQSLQEVRGEPASSSTATAPANPCVPTTPGRTHPPATPTKAEAPPTANGAAKTIPASTSTSTVEGKGVCTADDVEDIDCIAQQEAALAAKKSKTEVTLDPMSRQLHATMINQAIQNINTGKVREAEDLLNKVLKDNGSELSALVARGTARALRKELKGAIEDFGKAIEVEPRFPDSYKRRGVARSYLGDYPGALEDLAKYLELAPMFPDGNVTASRAECYMERGMIYHKQRDYRRAVGELKRATQLDSSNTQAWNLLGLCSVSMGDIDDGVHAYEKALQLNPQLKEAWLNMAQALKEQGKVKEAEAAFNKMFKLEDKENQSPHALRIMAQMRQGQGQHSKAFYYLNKALELSKDEQQKVELHYVRAICNHALGRYAEAARDYENCMGTTPHNVTEEARTFQFRSFYQKEYALFLYKNLDRVVSTFSADNELTPLFKELWCKKGPPTREFLSTYQPQSLPDTRNKLMPPPPDAAQLKQLTELADKLGVLLQNRHQGFLPNVRQQRASGYAATELAQTLLQVVAARREGREFWIPSEGATSQAGSCGRHQFGWRDAMDIVVKWRQLAEPNDEVVWVDLLTRREFEQGFGSHTPMFSGQTKCVRYYMNFERALNLHRKVLLEEGCAYDAANRKIPVDTETKRAQAKVAKTAMDMYDVIREDSWVVVPIQSVSRPNHTLEGTRLTLVKVPNQPDSFEFSIRTPVTPPRWKDFDAELEAGFENILNAWIEGDKKTLGENILIYAYYWYNFMPLARGTAAVGYTTILGMMWGAGMPVNATIPKDYQVDWQAILAQEPSTFVSSVGSWLLPPAARGLPTPEEHIINFPLVDTLPVVSEVLDTIRRRIEALNGPDAKRLS